MFARSAKFILPALAVLCAAAPAHADSKEVNFTTGTPLGLSLQVGVVQNPNTELVGPNQDVSTKFSHYFAFEPFLDFGNFVVRGTIKYNPFPIVSSSGADAKGAYSESSDLGMMMYGAQVLLAPYVSEDNLKRGYIRLGLSGALARGNNKRNYTSGVNNGNGFEEKFEGMGRELTFGGGFEIFIVKNYSLQIETGFRQLEFEEFNYRGGSDLSGNAKSSGAPLVNNAGANRTLDASGGYFSVGANVNF